MQFTDKKLVVVKNLPIAGSCKLLISKMLRVEGRRKFLKSDIRMYPGKVLKPFPAKIDQNICLIFIVRFWKFTWSPATIFLKSVPTGDAIEIA